MLIDISKAVFGFLILKTLMLHYVLYTYILYKIKKKITILIFKHYEMKLSKHTNIFQFFQCYFKNKIKILSYLKTFTEK